MKGLANYTTKSLRANRVRTFVTVAGVALAAALLTAVLTTYTSLTDFLYREEVNVSGTWMAAAECQTEDAARTGLQRAEQDPHVTGTAVVSDVGFAELSRAQQEKLGNYQAIVSADGDIQQMIAVKADEGRMPERTGEILLYRGWQIFEGVQLGDEISFSVGQREVVVDDEKALEGAVYDHRGGAVTETVIAPCARLNSSVSYLGNQSDGSGIGEHLVDLHTRTYTVVGFYDRVSYALFTGTGSIAVTVDDPEATGYTEAYLTLEGMSDQDAVKECTQDLFPDSNVVLHVSLLRFMGIGSDASLWSTFLGIVSVLAAVIMLACLSLIFNAFDISVAERIRQFGLLSSIGATRGQILRAVLLEAIIVACVGIPVGLVVGIGGCAVTFAFLGPMISELATGSLVPFTLEVDVRVMLLAAVLTFVTVAISAWIPAKRASRTRVVESLNSTGFTRVSVRGQERAARAVDPKHLWKGGGWDGAIFGIGGRLAKVNRKRSRARGRAASVSLALAIVLLMTAGSLNTFLGLLVGVVAGEEPAADVAVIASLTSVKDGESTAGTGEETVEGRGVNAIGFADQAAFFKEAYGSFSQAPDAVGKGWVLSGDETMAIPDAMAGESLRDFTQPGEGQAIDGDISRDANIYYLPDEQFEAYVKELGLEMAEFQDQSDVRAIGLACNYGNDGRMYRVMETFASSGTVKVDDQEVQIVALADEMPAVMGGRGERPTIFLPLSEANALPLSACVFKAFFDPADGDHAALAEELNKVGDEVFAEAPFDLSFAAYNDYRAQADSTHMLALVVNVFCLLFSIILTLIALANIFNTVTNSLVLRRREFAVMRSIGLSNKQFRAMIVDECASFGIAGLVPGLVISAAISWLLWFMISQSLSGFAFTLPWGYVGLSVLLTGAAMGASVAYGMRRCRADNVVDALRE